jgi:hypothetical protein
MGQFLLGLPQPKRCHNGMDAACGDGVKDRRILAERLGEIATKLGRAAVAMAQLAAAVVTAAERCRRAPNLNYTPAAPMFANIAQTR